jgi:hypothetical protein
MTDEIITRDGERHPIAFGVAHIRGGVRDEVQTFALGGKEWEPKKLAELLHGVATENAAGISPDESGSGIEQYEAYCFFSDMPEHLDARQAFTIRTYGGANLAASSMASEGPDPRGQTKQDMRLKEGWFQFVLDMTARTHHAQLAMIESVMKRNAVLERENYDAAQLAKELIYEQAANTHAHEMAEKEYERRTMLYGKVAQLAPAITNQVLGREVFPQSTVDSSLVETIVEELDESTIKELLAVVGKKLKPEALAMLVGRMSEIAEKQAEKKAKEKKKNGLATS